jgi:hypothetical protein
MDKAILGSSSLRNLRHLRRDPGPWIGVQGDGKEKFYAFSAISAVNYYYNSMTKELEWFIGILR